MERIRKNEEFQKIYNSKSQKLFSYYSIMYIKKNNYDYNRLGVVVSKKNGNAVVRNRIKRLLREFFRKNEKNFSKENSFDIIVISKKHFGEKAFEIKYEEIEKDLRVTLKKGGYVVWETFLFFW